MGDRRRKHLWVGFALAFLGGSVALVVIPIASERLTETPSQQLPPQEEAKAQIFAIFENQAKAWNRRDLDAVLAAYWNSPELVIISTQPVQGFDTLKAGYIELYKTRGLEMGQLRYRDLAITDIRGDEAELTGRWTIVSSKETSSARCITKLRKFDNGWKIVKDVTLWDDPAKKE